VGVTASVLLGVAVKVGVSAGVIWMEAIGSGVTMVEVEDGIKVEVAMAPLCNNPIAIQPTPRMLRINTAINMAMTIFFSKNDFGFINIWLRL
jgi:hypothetical protein